MKMWEIFKDDNDYNEKSIIGFGAFYNNGYLWVGCCNWYHG